MAEIIEPVVLPLGLVGAEPPYYPSNYAYDIAVAGMPFFLAASQNYPYKRETAPYRRTQIDQRVCAIDEQLRLLHLEHAKLAGKFSMIEE